MPLLEPALATDTLYTLLPSNATKLEKDLLKLVPYSTVLQPIVAEMNTVGETAFPDDWKVWILQERGQLPLVEAIGNIDLVLTNSEFLLENNGTIAAVIKVCQMLGYPNAGVWQHEWETTQFGEFQIFLGKDITSQDSLVRLEKAVKFVKPLRCRLRRVYNGSESDIRRLILSRIKSKQNGVLNRQLLGHFSGYPSAHNPYLWVSSVTVDAQDIYLPYNQGQFTITVVDFPYSDTGIVGGILVDQSSNQITDDHDNGIEYISANYDE